MKITKNNDIASKKFWVVTNAARIQVETKWPEWKKSIKVTKYSSGFLVEQNKYNGNGSERK